MRYFLASVLVSLAACTSCCGCGGQLKTVYSMVTNGKYWTTTTGWLNLGIWSGLAALGVVLFTLAVIYFNNASVQVEETPAE